MTAAIEAALKTFPVVVVTGMRQVGKSTLLQKAPEFRHRRFVTLDDFAHLEEAKSSPETFLGEGETLTVDEAQRCPELLIAIKKAVDHDRVAGRFLLSGSANFAILKGVSESLAGRAIYRVSSRQPGSLGHVEGSPYFWGDISQREIDYVRNFTYRETNLLRLRVPLVYEDPLTPYARRRFSSTEGGTLEQFLSALDEREQDALAAERGVCVMYTHFGYGFVEHGQVDRRFERLMRRLAGLSGWFVPASELLDAVCGERCPTITPNQRRHLEGRWIAERLRHGAS